MSFLSKRWQLLMIYYPRKGCMIETGVKKKYAAAVLARIHGKVKYEDRTFQEIFRIQAEKLGKALTEGGSYIPFRFRL